MQGRKLDGLVTALSVRKRYQVLVLLMLAYNYLPLVFSHVTMAFYKGVPPHLCRPPLTAGTGQDNLSRYENVTVLGKKAGVCSTQLFLESGENITVTCKKGQWEYSPLHGENTIVSEWDLVCADKHLVYFCGVMVVTGWLMIGRRPTLLLTMYLFLQWDLVCDDKHLWDLVCENKHLANLATTIYFCGVMVGGLLFGYLSDLIGRRPILLLTLYLPAAIGVAVSFSPSYFIFCVLRFVQGVLIQGLQTSSYVLAMEFFLPAQRPLVGCVMEIFWGMTVVILPGLAYLLPDWRHLQLVISLPACLAIFYICVIPESLRWLVLKGRMDDAKRLVTRMASVNKLPFPKEEWEEVRAQAEVDASQPQQRYHFLHLFRTPQLRRRSVVLFYVWLTITTGYYGLTLSITSLPGNKYINFFISGLVELVHYALSIWLMQRFGRKRPLFVCFVCAGACCIISASIPHDPMATNIMTLRHVSTAFAIVGRFFMAGLFSIIFVYTTELYPTVIRNIGMGSCLFWARLGGVIAPQINQLGAGSVVLVPIMVFGVMMLLGGALLLLLPETHGHKLPDVISDVEDSSSLQSEGQDDGPPIGAHTELIVKGAGSTEEKGV